MFHFHEGSNIHCLYCVCVCVCVDNTVDQLTQPFVTMETLSFPDDRDRLSFPDDGDRLSFTDDIDRLSFTDDGDIIFS